MTWRERLALLLGTASPFTTSSDVALASPVMRADVHALDEPVAIEPLQFWQDPAHAHHLIQLARHSSHSSHRSHSSHVSGAGHSSHYSGSGYTVPAPRPVYAPPAPPAPPRTVYRAPAPSTSTASPPAASFYTPPPATPPKAAPSGALGEQLSGSEVTRPVPPTPQRLTQDDITRFVQRVQIALMIKGYDPGPADGDLKPQTREALKSYQAATGLTPSGNMDKDTLHALGVLK